MLLVTKDIVRKLVSRAQREVKRTGKETFIDSGGPRPCLTHGVAYVGKEGSILAGVSGEGRTSFGPFIFITRK